MDFIWLNKIKLRWPSCTVRCRNSYSQFTTNGGPPVRLPHLKALCAVWIMHKLNVSEVSLKGNCVYIVCRFRTMYTVYCKKCANYIVICNLVLEQHFLPSQAECVNGIKYLSASAQKGGVGGQRTTSVCCIMGSLICARSRWAVTLHGFTRQTLQ